MSDMGKTDEDNNDSRRGYRPGKRSKVQEVVDLTVEDEEDEGDQVILVSNAQPYYDDDDDEVEVVDAPPLASLMVDGTEADTEQAAEANNDDDQDVQLVGRRNVQALPHMRPHCTEFPYQQQNQEGIINVDSTNNNSTNARYCPRCYCYVCDVPVEDCQQWPTHCNATDHSQHWMKQRRRAALAARRGTVVVRLPSNASAFRAVVQVAREMNPQTLGFTCSKTTGIRMQAISVDDVTQMELYLPESGLAECSCSGGGGKNDGEVVYFEVAGSALREYLCPWFKGARKSDRLEFRTAIEEEGDGSQALEFLREHDTKDVPHPLQIKLQEDDLFDPVTIPETAYECVLSMKSDRLRDMFNFFLPIVSLGGQIRVTWQRQESRDMVTFCAEQNFVSSGGIRRARFHYFTNPLTDTVVSCNTDSGELYFNLRYLLSILKATTMSSVVELSFHEQIPSKIRYTVPEWSSGGDDGGLAYFVAPVRFEDESDTDSEGSMFH